MDRKIIYPAQIPLVEDQLQAARFAQIGIGRVAGALYGESGIGASGFDCTPRNGLTVTIAPGEIVIPGVIDTSSYGALPASTSALPRQFILVDPVSITVPSASGTYIIYGTPTTSDIDNTVLPYFNSANPLQTYAGSGNSGAGQPTVRSDAVTIGIGASTPLGSVPLWSVSVPSGATTIASSMISAAVGAPLYPSLDKIASRIVAPFNPNLAAAFGGYPAKSIVADPTTAGAYWVSTADNNLTAPGASGASWVNLFQGLTPTPVSVSGTGPIALNYLYLLGSTGLLWANTFNSAGAAISKQIISSDQYTTNDNGASGSRVEPDGWITQWGTATLPASGQVTSDVIVSFPTVFPNKCVSVSPVSLDFANTTAGCWPALSLYGAPGKMAFHIIGDTLSHDEASPTVFNKTVAVQWIARGR